MSPQIYGKHNLHQFVLMCFSDNLHSHLQALEIKQTTAGCMDTDHNWYVRVNIFVKNDLYFKLEVR